MTTERTTRAMLTRRSGILLHPSSLPGRYGVGELGPAAEEWLEFLAAAEQSVWQLLPLNPVGAEGCPYQSPATLAGSPLYVSVDRLCDDGLLDAADLAAEPELPGERVDYPGALAVKRRLLARAHAAFTPTADYRAFCRDQAGWLDDYARFMVLRDRHGGPWTRWPGPLARRDPAALARLDESAADDLDRYRFEQYLFARHFGAVRARAAALGVELIGDIAMFPGVDSVETWSRPDLFDLDADGRPVAVAGFPPDEFSHEGQVWGNALYRWDRMAADDFAWWVARVRRMTEWYDMVRLDHFRGFLRYWAVPVPGRAGDGSWRDGPGLALFQRLRKDLGEVTLLAEDLGPASAEVQHLRVDAGIPGMRLVQFAFGGDENQHLPHHHPVDCVAYPGTHDNDTTLGWWAERSADERSRVERYLGGIADGICWSMARAVFGSVAYLAVLPVQDLLELGSEARLNVPGRADGNWTWRLPPRALSPGLEFRLRRLTETYGRDRRAASRRPSGFTG
ncbi:4-alpha-glucanotransferase [Micromonospora sp. NPDC047707]|uniref:4-alpha-glucanotransferase n=1 Tax=Micromonospora sp. NPDC047707 TaxID=3154498 RepID=UPI0034567F2D